MKKNVFAKTIFCKNSMNICTVNNSYGLMLKHVLAEDARADTDVVVYDCRMWVVETLPVS